MIDFILAALPWVALAVAIAVVIVVFMKKKHQNTAEKPNDDNAQTNKKNTEMDYTSYGMCIGLCIGVAIGTAFMGKYGSVALTYGICFGMLVGVVAGACIKKK